MKLSYRADIDGLRALAILLVVFYHLQINLNGATIFQFGYIGVDIFFVISGYLIGRIILYSLSQNNFSFIKFYESRARRLLPALFFVILISLPLSYLFLLPNDLIEFANSIIASIFFFSNFFFYESQIQYGPQNFSLIPFLNTWSLAVEEQFYIIFPLVFFLIYKFLNNKYHIFLFYFILFFSLALAEYTYKFLSPSLNFYMLPTRIWELFAGVIIAYYELRNKNFTNSLFIQKFGAHIGIILLFISFFIFDENTKHPSIITTIPILGTCLIIIANHSRKNIIKEFFSHKYLVFIGLISYSLYLVHYPIIAFFRIYFFEDLSYDLIALSLISSFCLSIISYKYIEKPFRDKKKTSKKKLSLFILFCSTISIIVSIIFINTNGFASRLPEIFSNKSHIFPRDKLKDDNGICFHRINKFCDFDKFENRPKVILIGDSIMGSISYDLKNKLDKLKINFKTMIVGGCFYLPNFEIKNHQCSLELQNTMMKDIRNESIKPIIIIGGDLSNNLEKNNKSFVNYQGVTIEDGFIKSINDLLGLGYKIILLYPLPVFEENVSQKVFNLVRNSGSFSKDNYKKNENIIKKNLVILKISDYKSQSRNVYQIYDKINHENLIKIYPHQIFCNTYIKNDCVGNNEKNIFFHDKKHPSLFGSKLINSLIEEEIKKIAK